MRLLGRLGIRVQRKRFLGLSQGQDGKRGAFAEPAEIVHRGLFEDHGLPLESQANG